MTKTKRTLYTSETNVCSDTSGRRARSRYRARRWRGFSSNSESSLLNGNESDPWATGWRRTSTHVGVTKGPRFPIRSVSRRRYTQHLQQLLLADPDVMTSQRFDQFAFFRHDIPRLRARIRRLALFCPPPCWTATIARGEKSSGKSVPRWVWDWKTGTPQGRRRLYCRKSTPWNESCQP